MGGCKDKDKKKGRWRDREHQLIYIAMCNVQCCNWRTRIVALFLSPFFASALISISSFFSCRSKSRTSLSIERSPFRSSLFVSRITSDNKKNDKKGKQGGIGCGGIGRDLWTGAGAACQEMACVFQTFLTIFADIL